MSKPFWASTTIQGAIAAIVGAVGSAAVAVAQASLAGTPLGWPILVIAGVPALISVLGGGVAIGGRMNATHTLTGVPLIGDDTDQHNV